MTTTPTPWTLRFERDGTEDIAVIADESGDLFTSRHFWLPEEGDAMPATLGAVRLAAAAPKLLEAVEFILKDANSRLSGDAWLMLEAAYEEATRSELHSNTAT